MPILPAASKLVPVGAVLVPVLFGALVTVIGHLLRARWLIFTGLLMLALVFLVFSFVIQPGR